MSKNNKKTKNSTNSNLMEKMKGGKGDIKSDVLGKRKSKRIEISQANVRKSKRERNETGIRRGTNLIQIKRRKIPIPENQIKSIKRARSVALRNSSIRHNLPYY